LRQDIAICENVKGRGRFLETFDQIAAESPPCRQPTTPEASDRPLPGPGSGRGELKLRIIPSNHYQIGNEEEEACIEGSE
jgi:hypothetical protein